MLNALGSQPAGSSYRVGAGVTDLLFGILGGGVRHELAGILPYTIGDSQH